MSKSKIMTLESLARERLSKTFFMRDFLFSETAGVLGLSNTPSDKKLAIDAGKGLCQNVLEPIQDSWGRIHVRSAFRSEEVNQAGNQLGANCAANDANFAHHIWDRLDAEGNLGATACIVIPKYLNYFDQTGDWTSLAWWIHHHIPAYTSMCFFPKLCAFNINWNKNTSLPKSISTYVNDPNTGHRKRILINGEISGYYSNKAPEQGYAQAKFILDSL